MPLTLKLKSGQKIIINGAVIENAGPPALMMVHNKAAILRGKDVMTEGEADSPAKHTYFALQCAYLFEDDRERYLQLFDQMLREYVAAAPSATPMALEIVQLAASGDLYGALRRARDLLDHENERLRTVKGKGAAKAAIADGADDGE